MGSLLVFVLVFGHFLTEFHESSTPSLLKHKIPSPLPPQDWSDVKEDVNLGRWASARDPSSLSALILLFGDQRVAPG